ncbi:hypothetical protein RN001_000828 [Aquatica leii]|uniref:Enolase-phosphatase E1 n=1 Tax=Aquatica leii TaxID=1421715 RepID=A0AAN7Q7G4_9COLE|nr:hypothetical protein RN001_000828 [Aquatica leii]
MHSNNEANFEKVKVILVDIAGTTTSLEFVKEKLFAHINEEAAAFLKKNIEDEEVKKALDGIKIKDQELNTEEAVELIKKLTNENSENASLKTLQGLISKEGYQNGTLKAHVFEDVRSAFETWSTDKKIAIYSTGDKESQKLLFEHTTEGNLTSHISHYFDQSTGSKSDPESYTKLFEELKVSSDEILFINDNAEELMAAKKSGLLTALIKREGNAAVDEETLKEFTITITSFADLSFEVSNKRKIDDATDGTEIPPPKVPKTEETNTKNSDANAEAPKKTEEIVETINAKNEEQEKPTETSSEVEPMEVDGTEKETEEEKPEKAATDVTGMEIEEVKSSETATKENNTTEPQKTDVVEDKTNVEHTKTEVDAVEKKPIETDTKTESMDNVDSCKDSEDVVITKIEEEDTKKETIKEDNIEVALEKESKTVTETKTVLDSEVDGSGVESKTEKTETESVEVTASNSLMNDEPCATNTAPETSVESAKTNHEQSDSNGEINKVAEEPLADKTEVAETKVQEENESVIDKPLDKIANEEKVEESSKDDTTKSDSTNVISSGDDSKVVVEDKNGVSENGNSNEEKTNNTKSNEDVTNGVAHGQENGNKSTGAKEPEEETEIKVKKIETNEGSPAVSVEV